MPNTNTTEPVQQHPALDDSHITDAEYRRAIAAYLKAVHEYQQKIIDDLNRQAERYRRQHPNEVTS